MVVLGVRDYELSTSAVLQLHTHHPLSGDGQLKEVRLVGQHHSCTPRVLVEQEGVLRRHRDLQLHAVEEVVAELVIHVLDLRHDGTALLEDVREGVLIVGDQFVYHRNLI